MGYVYYYWGCLRSFYSLGRQDSRVVIPRSLSGWMDGHFLSDGLAFWMALLDGLGGHFKGGWSSISWLEAGEVAVIYC